MKQKGMIRTIADAIRDPDRVLEERMFLALASISEATVFFALIGDFLVKENIWEILTLIAVLIFVPLVSYICLKLDKMNIAMKIYRVLGHIDQSLKD